jgi:(1->4)-alpha-D-glucan 1-alpha-D-glucosylmutase
LNEKHRRNGLPDRNAEYLFYQTLVGAWPLALERALAFMEKASREAKQHTSWTDPNAAYDNALRHFVSATLQDNEFGADLERFVAPLVDPGRVTALAQTLLRLTAPGVPDIYQGNELWDLSLVDPDNRRPVDFGVRQAFLAEMERLSPEQVWERRDEGLPKLWLIRKTLDLRRRHPDWFGAGAAYAPVTAHGLQARCVVAYRRGNEAITVVPRLVLGVRGNWGDTTIEVPPGDWRDVLGGQTVPGGSRGVADLFRRFPVALLARPTPKP